MRTLIFPYVGKEAESYARDAKQRGDHVLLQPPGGFPNIHDSEFADVFYKTVIDNSITHLFCPVASVHKFMQSFPHGLVLLGESPIQKAVREHNELMERAISLSHLAPDVSLIDLAGVLKGAMSIYGESNEEKLAAMIGIFADAPDGDVVEVGSLCGRTAFVLRWCALRYQHQFMLTVDPWSAVAGVQVDSPALLAAMTAEWDWDTVAEIFAVNIALLGHTNHLRTTSADGFAEYIKDPQDGIAVLHIDGNHDYDNVKQDIELWCSMVVPGGWLVLDDYRWPHGDGPKRAGDELLSQDVHDRSFEAGGALFVRFKP